MTLEENIKYLNKMTKKQTQDIAELKKLLVETKITKNTKREINSILNQMIVRVETTWANLRALGRTINDTEGNE